ncbi:MAG TPA: endolytic transglycosylase MltG [Bacteroidota bacterium]
MRTLTPHQIRLWILPPLGAFLAVLFVLYYIFWMPISLPEPEGKVVIIPRGVSFKSVTDTLEENGIIRSRLAFEIAGRVLGYTKTIKVGKYLFHSGLSNTDILSDINEGKSREITAVTIPEGWRMEMIAKRFAKDLGVDGNKILALCRDSAFAASRGIRAPSLEGYLMPDTYKFYWQTDEVEIVDRMLNGFRNFFVDSLKARLRDSRMTLNEVVTLASIVEGESGIDAELPTIAGVYLNRLRKNMKLEADPTIQYLLPAGPRRLRYADLRMDSPYNTYLYRGLPPGPVNNPGRLAILSVLYPEKNQYLYFVATGVGGHHFSRTYSEHEKAVRVFRKVRREMQKNRYQGG